MKERIQLYSSLYVGCKSRQANLDDFFRHENHEYPPSISEYGKIRKPTAKSDFLKCLPTIEGTTDQASVVRHDAPLVDACIVDGPALVQMNAPKLARTYGEYCEFELGNKVKSIANGEKRIDIVFDVYKSNSRKRETRESRGKGEGVRILIKRDTPVYRDFKQVMAIAENKTELFTLIADTLVETFKESSETVVATRLQNVVSNHEIPKINLEPCKKEEADDRMFLHAKDLSSLGFRKILIVTVDTDVIVIGLYAFWDLDVQELWVEFGVGKTKTWLPIHYYANLLGEEVCRAVLFWYALTGCDTVSHFQGRGKKTAWKTWGRYREATETFAKLSTLNILSDADLHVVEQFVVLLYDSTCPYSSVNECRRYLFAQLGRMIDNCPPTQNALYQHIRRAMLQSYIWSRCLILKEPTIDIGKWGWTTEGKGLVHPIWSTLPKASLACKELKHCKCKKLCSSEYSCTCKTYGLSCTELCRCEGYCE